MRTESEALIITHRHALGHNSVVKLRAFRLGREELVNYCWKGRNGQKWFGSSKTIRNSKAGPRPPRARARVAGAMAAGAL